MHGPRRGMRWPRPWRVKAAAGLDSTRPGVWQRGPACRRPGALDPGGSNVLCPVASILSCCELIKCIENVLGLQKL
jgi:hypothetical protein